MGVDRGLLYNRTRISFFLLLVSCALETQPSIISVSESIHHRPQETRKERANTAAETIPADGRVTPNPCLTDIAAESSCVAEKILKDGQANTYHLPSSP